jgi:hypothetical protein
MLVYQRIDQNGLDRPSGKILVINYWRKE